MATLLNLQTSEAILDPINATDGATVSVTYPEMQSDHRIAVNWGTLYTSESKYGSNAGPITFDIPTRVVAASLRQTLPVSYSVVRPGQEAQQSKPLDLKVRALDIEHLPRPRVPQASAGMLDLGTFTGNASVQLEPWPLIAVGQRYWIRASGTRENGTPHQITIAFNQAVTQGEINNGVEVTLPRTELEQLRHASTLTIAAKVAFDGEPLEDAAQALPELVLDISEMRRFPAPTVPEAPNGVITNPERPVTLLIPAAARLRAGEHVSGVLGTRRTDPVIVPVSNAALQITVPLGLLERAEGTGTQMWHYEVQESSGTPSAPVQITVLATTPLSENFNSGAPQWLNPGNIATFPALRVRNDAGPAIQIAQNSDHPPLQGIIIAFRNVSVMSLLLRRNVRSVQFDLINYLEQVHMVEFFDTTESTMPFASAPISASRRQRFSYFSPGPAIRRIRFTGISSKTSIWLDNFTFSAS
ncbi:hypothetical protein [Pseudomonas sp. microsymbiont 2]